MGSCLTCSAGLTPSALMVIPKAPVLDQGRPVATILDHIPFVNILPFGMCTSKLNPASVAAGGGPVPCTPVTPMPWMPPFPLALAPVPMVTKGSTLTCMLGGTITIKS